MDLERDGNLVEAGVWFVLAVALFVHAFRVEKRIRPTLFIIVVALVAFGVSDLIETRTGAWKPWWLFVWKAACVAMLLFGFIRYYRERKAKPRINTDEHR